MPGFGRDADMKRYTAQHEDTRHHIEQQWDYKAARGESIHRERDKGSQLQSVLPDVIVHRQGDDNSNLMVIEMKKSSRPSGIESDRQRLMAFRDQLDYKLGGLVIFRTGRCPNTYVDYSPWLKALRGG